MNELAADWSHNLEVHQVDQSFQIDTQDCLYYIGYLNSFIGIVILFSNRHTRLSIPYWLPKYLYIGIVIIFSNRHTGLSIPYWLPKYSYRNRNIIFK